MEASSDLATLSPGVGSPRRRLEPHALADGTNVAGARCVAALVTDIPLLETVIEILSSPAAGAEVKVTTGASWSVAGVSPGEDAGERTALSASAFGTGAFGAFGAT